MMIKIIESNTGSEAKVTAQMAGTGIQKKQTMFEIAEIRATTKKGAAVVTNINRMGEYYITTALSNCRWIASIIKLLNRWIIDTMGIIRGGSALY